jgi:hypothetical protein
VGGGGLAAAAFTIIADIFPPEQRARKDFTNSRLVIDATRPFEWRSEFPEVAEMSPAMRAKVEGEWGDFLLAPGNAMQAAQNAGRTGIPA